jgi:hypothetical protein
MALSGEEFMRRYMQHILPKGFVRIRYVGLLHTRFALELERIKRNNGEVIEQPEDKPVEKPCKECDVPRVVVREIRPWWEGLRKRSGNSISLREAMEVNAKARAEMNLDGSRGRDRAPPHNNLVERPAGGRHDARLREPRAGSLRARPSGPAPSGRPRRSPERYTDGIKDKTMTIITRQDYEKWENEVRAQKSCWFPPPLSLRASGLRPCSQLNRALYGRNKDSVTVGPMNGRRAAFIIKK